MGIGDLFKTQREREKDLVKKRRRAFREASRSVDRVKDRIKTLKQERDRAWQEARQYLKSGQRPAAQRSLQTYRASEILTANLEKKRWVFEQLITKLDLARTDQEFASAMHAINEVVNIDPEQVDDVLGEVQDRLGEQVDTDKIWADMHSKEMEGVETEMPDMIPSLAEMEAQLEDEVAAEIGEGTSAKLTGTDKDSKLEEAIGEGRRRLRDLLEGEK